MDDVLNVRANGEPVRHMDAVVDLGVVLRALDRGERRVIVIGCAIQLIQLAFRTVAKPVLSDIDAPG